MQVFCTPHKLKEKSQLRELEAKAALLKSLRIQYPDRVQFILQFDVAE